MTAPVISVASIPATDATRHPRIGYNNVGALGTITTDSETTGYEAVHLFDWKPYTYWMPLTAGTHYVQVALPYAMEVDYFAFAQHNLGTNGASISLQYSTDGVSFFTACAGASPASTEAMWFSFTAIRAGWWRVVVTSATPSAVAVCAFGKAYQPLYGTIEGFRPFLLSRTAEIYASTSEAGNFLGRSILRRSLSTSLELNHMTPYEAYYQWLPFMKHAESKPFFVVWNLEDYAFDMGLFQSDGAIPSPTFSRPGRLTASIMMRGLLV